MEKRILPIGVDDYKELVEQNFYYIDKTLFIKELMDNLAKVNLFTRPRRFGKTLNLSMLRYFFEKPENGSSNAYLFKDKKIMKEDEKYRSHQEQYPVIQLALKSGKQPDYAKAYKMIRLEIAKEFKRHAYILENMTDEYDAAKFRLLSNENNEDDAWLEALAFLSRCLENYYHQKVIVLIDEYDVPLENAYYCGFYQEMIGFIRSLFESVLKSNLSLKFAVITGCLRISKESIFTGLNNLDMISILNTIYSEHFGFTQKEVDKVLSDYHIESKSSQIREWYDGYIFGETEVYNPWSVINYVRAACADKNAFPLEYWSNTSSNSIVKDLICRAKGSAKKELEELMRGGTIEKTVHEEVTYEDIYDSEDNLWNFLYFVGYLKKVSIRMEDNSRLVTLAIPNIEVKNIYKNQIQNWFRETMKKRNLEPMYQAMLEADEETLQKELSKLLLISISYMDGKEAFYHGFLLGILINMENQYVDSNRESGLGRYDICIQSDDVTIPPVIMEFKIAKNFQGLEEAAKHALAQIESQKYSAGMPEKGHTECVYIGIGFFLKQCKVKCCKVKLE